MDGVTENGLLDGRVRLLQPEKGYRSAIDPVLLAAALPDEAEGLALDVGCGTGAAMLCLLARTRALEVVGLEIQPDHAAMASASITLNGWQNRAKVAEGDVAARSVPVAANSFDYVLTNPPYHGPGTSSDHPGREMAHRDTLGIEVWLRFCLKMLKPGGKLALIHRADRLDEILSALRPKAGSVEVLPLWPKKGGAAKRIIVRATKGAKGPLTLHAGLVLHCIDGSYTIDAAKILRDGLGIDAVMSDSASVNS